MIYEKPTRLIKYEFKGDLISCVGHPFCDFRVTPDHNMLISREITSQVLNTNYEFLHSKNLSDNFGLMSSIIWEGQNNEKYHFNTSSKVVPMELWLKFIGIYMIIGSLQYDNTHTINMAIDNDNNINIKFSVIMEILKNFGVSTTLDQNEIKIRDKPLYDELKFLKLVGDLRVPLFIFEQSPKNIMKFIDGYCLFNGCTNKKTECIHTSSKLLVDDFQRLILLAGYGTYVLSYEENSSHERSNRVIIGKHREYHILILFSQNSMITSDRYIKNIPYNDYVYCAEVPTYHTLITRRNYKILISGNCTANAIGGAYEFDLIKEKNMKIFTPSRLFIYYNERKLEGTINEDSGAELRDGIKTINKVGVCPEPLWEYNIEKFAIEPSSEAYQSASHHKCIQYKRVTQVLSQLKQCLIEGFPFVFGMLIFE